MKFLIRLYNLFCYVISLPINIYLICKNYDKKEYDFFKSFINNIHDVSQIQRLICSFEYKSDPEMKILNKTIKLITKKDVKLTWNFIPFLIVFFLRKGGDCSVFSRCIKKMLRKLKIKSKQILIFDNVGSFLDKLQTMHIVTVVPIDEKSIYIYNVNQLLRTDMTVENIFKKKPLVEIGGHPYKYKKPVTMRWI